MQEWKNFISELLKTERMKEHRTLLWILFIAGCVSLLVAIALYVLRAISVYTMAKSADLATPWMAFVPILNVYTFGVLAEKLEMPDGKKSMKYGGSLLFINLIKRILAALAVLLVVIRVSDFFDSPEKIDVANLGRKLIPLLFLVFLAAGLAIVETVLHYIALYRIFMIFQYQNAVLFTLLSVLGLFFVSDILEPILLLLVRKKTPVFSYRDRLEQASADGQQP